MTDLVFVDTNVFIYCIEENDPAKQQNARKWRSALWQSRHGRTGFQVLQEFYFQATRKWPLQREQIRKEIDGLMTWNPVAVDGPILHGAWQIQDRYRLSFWDALIIAAAQASSCRYLLTEELQEGQDFEGVTVVNPFHRDFASLSLQ